MDVGQLGIIYQSLSSNQALNLGQKNIGVEKVRKRLEVDFLDVQVRWQNRGQKLIHLKQ